MSKRYARILRNCLIAFVLLAGWLTPVSISAQTQTPPPPRLTSEQQTALQALREQIRTGALPALVPAQKQVPQIHQDSHYSYAWGAWTRMVFQSYRDGNWEIYTAAGDTTNPVRVTNHPASDIMPRLNTDGSQIVFVSRRDGNSEIYSMNADGSNLKRLTNISADDEDPSWSPDGTQIAFDSKRDGHWEIYVMNADGSGQRRLTVDNGKDPAKGKWVNITPSWAPDGSHIIWAHDSSKMTLPPSSTMQAINPDGTNRRNVGMPSCMLISPVYSPDMTKVAYSEISSYYDSFFGVSVFEFSRGFPYGGYSHNGTEDVMMGNWLPDNKNFVTAQAGIETKGGQ